MIYKDYFLEVKDINSFALQVYVVFEAPVPKIVLSMREMLSKYLLKERINEWMEVFYSHIAKIYLSLYSFAIMFRKVFPSPRSDWDPTTSSCRNYISLSSI